MLVCVDQLREHVIFDDFGHKAGHGATCARDEVQHGLAPVAALQSAFNPVHLTFQAADAGQQLISLSDRMHADAKGRWGPLMPPSSDFI